MKDANKESILNNICEKHSANKLYGVLGVERRASQDEIRQAYKELALVSYPDENQDNKDLAAKAYQCVQDAYGTLSDADRKKDYDDERSKRKAELKEKRGSLSKSVGLLRQKEEMLRSVAQAPRDDNNNSNSVQYGKTDSRSQESGDKFRSLLDQEGEKGGSRGR